MRGCLLAVCMLALFALITPHKASACEVEPVLRIKGTVTLGKEPLAATLWLSQKPGQRLVFDSDDRGRFSGVLPGEGL
jgi:hypothetical protein